MNRQKPKPDRTPPSTEEPTVPPTTAQPASKRALLVLFCLCRALLTAVMLTVLLRAPALRVASVSYESPPPGAIESSLFSSVEASDRAPPSSKADPSSAAPAYTLPLPLNTATAEQLSAALPGIGEVIAERIVAYRVEHGGFTSLDELLEVEGIGEKKLKAIRSLLTLDAPSEKNEREP